MARVDLVVLPVTTGTAPLQREPAGADFAFTLPASLSGGPALSVPAGAGPDGLPIGVQLVGRPWEDHVVLAAGRLVERAQAADPAAPGGRLTWRSDDPQPGPLHTPGRGADTIGDRD